MRPLCSRKRLAMDSVEGQIESAEGSHVKRLARMFILIFFERDQTLAPINVAVSQVFPRLRLLHQRREVREVVRSITNNVCCVESGEQTQRDDCLFRLAESVPRRCSRDQ